MIFKRRSRALKVSLIKEPKESKALFEGFPGIASKVNDVLLENVTRHGKDFLTHAAATVVVAYSAVRVVDTICKIAVVTAKAKVQ